MRSLKPKKARALTEGFRVQQARFQNYSTVLAKKPIVKRVLSPPKRADRIVPYPSRRERAEAIALRTLETYMPHTARSQLKASSAEPQTSLRIPSQKPRPKLMYRALLPPSMLPPQPTTVASEARSRSPKQTDSVARPVSGDAIAGGASIAQMLEELDNEDYAEPSESLNHETEVQEPSCSPLFVPTADAPSSTR